MCLSLVPNSISDALITPKFKGYFVKKDYLIFIIDKIKYFAENLQPIPFREPKVTSDNIIKYYS